MRVLGVLLLLSVLSSCGKSNSNAGLPLEGLRPLPINEAVITDFYLAKLFTINPNVDGIIPSSATIERQGNKLFAHVRIMTGTPNLWPKQYIYEGNRCPDGSDDISGDGLIDKEEANNALGQVLISLTADLNAQRAPDQGIELEGKAVVIYGELANSNLPIACGIFQRVTTIPDEQEYSPDTGTEIEPEGLPETSPTTNERPEYHEETNSGRNWLERVINRWRQRRNGERGDLL